MTPPFTLIGHQGKALTINHNPWPECRRLGKIVSLRGNIKRVPGEPKTNFIAQLPPDMWPAQPLNFSVAVHGAHGAVDLSVSPDGRLEMPRNDRNAAYLHLVSFSTAGEKDGISMQEPNRRSY